MTVLYLLFVAFPAFLQTIGVDLSDNVVPPKEASADQSLFWEGAYKFRRQDYAGADAAFSRLVLISPHYVHTPQAIKCSLLAKLQLADDDAQQRRRLLRESLQLIEKVRQNYPELLASDREFFARQAVVITRLEASLDFTLAQTCEKHGFCVAAYYYYDYIQWKYPMLDIAQQARKGQEQLTHRLFPPREH